MSLLTLISKTAEDLGTANKVSGGVGEALLTISLESKYIIYLLSNQIKALQAISYH